MIFGGPFLESWTLAIVLDHEAAYPRRDDDQDLLV